MLFAMTKIRVALVIHKHPLALIKSCMLYIFYYAFRARNAVLSSFIFNDISQYHAHLDCLIVIHIVYIYLLCSYCPSLYIFYRFFVN